MCYPSLGIDREDEGDRGVPFDPQYWPYRMELGGKGIDDVKGCGCGWCEDGGCVRLVFRAAGDDISENDELGVPEVFCSHL